MYDLAIIGAGTAGLTAAIYARRAEKKVLVLEGGAYGGQIVETLKIENYPGMFGVSGPEFAKALYEQALALGAEIEFEEVSEVEKAGEGFVLRTEDGEYSARAVVIATGVREKRLGLPFEEELVGGGVSYCATCDGAFYRGKTVAVEGGGNTALYSAEYLAGICEKVYLIHRRAEFRGDEALVARVKALSNVEVILGTTITELRRGEDGKLAGVVLDTRGMSEEFAESDGGGRGVDATGGSRELEVAGLFVAIGREPNTALFADLVERDEDGFVIADEQCRTSCPGVFVAGDAREKNLRQLVTATADGAVAATAAIEYIAG